MTSQGISRLWERSRRLALSALFALLCLAGFFGAWPLMFVALCPLVVAVVPVRRGWVAAVVAFVAAYGLWFCGQWFLSVYNPAALVLLVAWHALTVALAVVSARAWRRRWGCPLAFGLPVAWVGAEYVRMLGPFALPNGLAQSCHRQLWMIQVCDLGGTYILSFAIAMVNGWLADLWLASECGAGLRPAEGPAGGLAPEKEPARCLSHGLRLAGCPDHGGGLIAGGVATLLVWVGVAGYGAYRLAESRTTMRPGPAIGVVQPDVVYANNIADGFDPDLLRQQLQGLSEQSAREPVAPSLIVWPEAISPDASLNQEFLEAPYEEARAAAWLGFNSLAQVPPAQRSLLRPRWEADLTALRKGETDFRRWVADLKVPVLLGAVAMVPRANDAGECWSRFNAALLYTPEAGQAPRRQYKIGLFPLQEAVPWPGTRAHRWLRDGLAQRGTMTPRHWLTPGRERLTFELPDRHGGAGAPPLRYVISFCSESLRPETTASFVTRRDGAKPVDLLINLGNEGGFQRNREQPFHFSLLPFRAVEARVAVAQSVNTGISGFVKPTGEIYGVVTNGRGQYWTGRGAPELPLIANLVRLRRERADEIARDPALARRVNADIARIEALRREVGILGQSTQTVYSDSRVTLYSRSGDWFAKLLLALWAAGAVAGTVPGSIRALAQWWRARVR